MKKRLDILVYEKGFAESREKAKAIIMAGQVYVDNQKADKCGAAYDENVKLEVRGRRTNAAPPTTKTYSWRCAATRSPMSAAAA